MPIEGNQSFQLWSESGPMRRGFEAAPNLGAPDQDGLVAFDGADFQRKFELKFFEVG